MLKNKKNEKFTDYFFKNHKLFVCNNLPWQLFNFENSKSKKHSNLQTRIEYLFSKNGFAQYAYTAVLIIVIINTIYIQLL